MADLDKIQKLKTLLDLYGVGVRAGVVTPQVEDEVYFRKIIDLPEMSKANVADWEKSGSVRHPITLLAHDAHGNPVRSNGGAAPPQKDESEDDDE